MVSRVDYTQTPVVAFGSQLSQVFLFTLKPKANCSTSLLENSDFSSEGAPAGI